MDGVLRYRQSDLTGIVNGVDTDIWNPATDPNITPYKTASGKLANKKALQKTFGLGRADGPLYVLVSRLTAQKGIDLLLDALPELLKQGGQLALLGSGDPQLEVALLAAAASHENVSVKIGYDELLAHQMMAGGDVILVPSRFEPCGLTQLYGLRYGTLPLVALTGGLADTVSDSETGFVFDDYTTNSFWHAVQRATYVYNTDKSKWKTIQKNGMKQDFSWASSAEQYVTLYKSML